MPCIKEIPRIMMIIIISLSPHRIPINLNTYEERMSGESNVKGQT
jgi:hypothetical protein